jgi:hypothetical protein
MNRFIHVLVVSTVLLGLVSAAEAQTRPLRRSSVRQPVPVRPTPQPVGPTDLAPRPTGGTGIGTSCEGVDSCNDFIALCVAAGGDFTPTSEDDEGRPTRGDCEVNN